MSRLALVIVAALSVAPAFAQERSTEMLDPEKQALAYELQECVGAKIRTSTQFFALRAQLEAATKRADDAEARLKAAEKPSSGQ